ncbi:MAG TPA: signal peptide peptidase SppA [Candidatus Krumholzibacteria bacterium]|nr:signal peptide peptidase SppA [Candidatus Krumholzibacteria bacterium]
MNFFKMVLAVLVAQVLLAFVLFFGLGVMTALFTSGDTTVHVTDGSWLVIDLYGEIPPYDEPESIAGSIFAEPETLAELLVNLEKAAADERLAGVVMKISSSNSLGLASLGELRTSIARVRESGKPVIAFSDDLDRNSLYLAAACDSIFMPNVADLTFTGYGAVESFYKGTLDKLGVHQNLHKIDEYKTAAEPFQRDSMSPENREMTGWLLQEVWEVELGAISRDRGLSMDSLVACMDHALFTPEEAKQVGLIDGVVYWDELEKRLSDEDELPVVTSAEYGDVLRADVGLKGKSRIAVVHAYGFIGGRESRTDPGLGIMMGHETVVENLRAAADDDRVDAVVLRVDSPGGESLASQIIAREVGKIAAEKPIVVSMGDVAASGGYAIAYPATKIVADSLTITGSIGSIYGKLNIAGAWNKIGITFDSVTKGPNALLWSTVHDFDQAQWKRIEAHHHQSVDQWLAEISKARNIPVEELRGYAEGRVWTGRQAKERKLVDEVGGFSRAIEVAKEAAGIPIDEEVTLDYFPKKRGLYALLMSGDAPITLLRGVVVRALRQDAAETMRVLQRGGEWRLWTGAQPVE